MALTTEQLHTLAFAVTPDILKEYSHLSDLWQALLGGYVLPEMAKSEPESIVGNAGYKALMDKYSKENIAEMFKGEDKIVEVIKEVPTIIEKTVVVREGEHVVHRRLKSDIHKISRKKRPLNAAERDLVIKVFNEKQDMLDKTSEVFKNIADVVDAARDEDDKVSAPQLAGYWSSLCRWADRPKVRREQWIEKSLKKCIFNITPVYSERFVAKIKANYMAKRAEAAERAKDHAKIRTTGERRKILVSELAPAEPLPAAALDLTDIL
jgi:hypothetical protein